MWYCALASEERTFFSSALSLPKKCQGNKNVCSKCQGQKKSNKPKDMKKKEDARGASVGKRPEGTGS